MLTDEPDVAMKVLLKENGVSKAFRVVKKVDEEKIPTLTWILTFTSIPPPSIVLGYYNYPLGGYKRGITQCAKCWSFGHT